MSYDKTGMGWISEENKFMSFVSWLHAKKYSYTCLCLLVHWPFSQTFLHYRQSPRADTGGSPSPQGEFPPGQPPQVPGNPTRGVPVLTW